MELETDVSKKNKTKEFENLLNEDFKKREFKEGKIIKATVSEIGKKFIFVETGLKSEGSIPIEEFKISKELEKLKVGSKIDVYLEKIESYRTGEIVVSREKAKRMGSWEKMTKAFENQKEVEGIITNKVKGGFIVNIDSCLCFLPGSQVDTKPIKNMDSLMNTSQKFLCVKLDKSRGNIVVSRRAILEESRAEQRAELVGNLAEGSIADGVVKNITEYGAFIDLGGVDGLLHVTDMAWRRVNHPSELLNIGDTIKVQVIKINKDTHRISLGMKQLQDDPWSDVEKRYPLGSNHTGRVTNITDYGAFVELESGVEGLVHVSEMSWTKKNVHPGKIVSTSQELEVMVLEIDTDKRRVSLGLKQTKGNPWENFAENNPVGSNVEGEIKNITEFGLFVGLGEDIDGMVHLTDLDWNKSGEEALEIYKKGDLVKAQVIDIDIEKERISLSIKALEKDPFSDTVSDLKRGQIVTVTISNLQENGVDVEYNGINSFIRRSDLSRDRSEQRSDKFVVGDKVDARITNIDKANRKVNFSIKAKEIAEEKEAVQQYGSSDSGASLGDILGAALNKEEEKD